MQTADLLCRAVYSKLASVGEHLADALLAQGEGSAVDMSVACMCETMDALGLAGFDKMFHNLQSFKKGQVPLLLNVGPTLVRFLSVLLLCLASPFASSAVLPLLDGQRHTWLWVRTVSL